MNDVFFCVSGMPQVLPLLRSRGIPAVEEPRADVTHLLLPVPLFDTEHLESLLHALPRNVTVLGGKLSHPLLETYKKFDFLQDEYYLAQNAALTAEAALRLAGNQLPVRFLGLRVLIIGWGRIGKCLAQQLRQLGAQVCVAARKERDRAMIASLGCDALTVEQMPRSLDRCRVIFNTVPAPVLQAEVCPPDCIKLDLASVRGIEGENVIHARGLPGKLLPEAQAELIVETALRLLGKEDTQ